MLKSRNYQNDTPPALSNRSLLRLLLLPLRSDDLAQHHHTVAIQEGDARQTLAVLEGVHHQRLLRREVALAISLDFSECGSSIFLPPVSLPIFQTIFETRQAARPQRTNPIGEYPTLISPGMSKTWICALKFPHAPRVVSFLYTITSPVRGMFCLSRPPC